jgi:serine/threonine protein kinase/tetratricopeptide (TPR) repeat protein
MPNPMIEANEALRAAFAGRYRIERELGRGGMATMYLAHDLLHGRPVWLKVLRPDVSGALHGDRFTREVAAAARLTHPHILRISDSGSVAVTGGAPALFYVSPHVAGVSLRERLQQEPQLALAEAVGIARQVAAALDHAHREGATHRDIRPETILLAEGDALVADFGIAGALDSAGGDRLAEVGLAPGTPAYMSPEQGAGSTRVDGRADIYALGCVLYEMLAGQPPFTGPTREAVVARHARDPVPSLRTVRSTVSPELDAVVTRALAKAPADRFKTAGAFRQALERSASSVLVTPPGRQGAWVARSGFVAGAFAVGLLAVLAAVHMSARRPPESPESSGASVAVLPFRTSGASPDLAWLSDGLVDLLTIHLTGEGGLRAADPRRVIRQARRWSGVRGSEEPETALELAERLGSTRLIDGSVAGTADHLVVTASVIGAPDGRTLRRASVEGPVDSVGSMVRRLVADLLASEAGQKDRLGDLGSLTLPTVRAFLDGQAALREARWNDAFRHFSRALDLDSTLAQAAMGLMEAEGWNGGDSDGRGERLAWIHRDRLSSGDRVLLSALLGPTYPYPGDGVESTDAYERAITVAPDRPEVWYHLGENYYHWGAAIGLKDARGLAARAFRRAIELDSSLVTTSRNAELMVHLRQIATNAGDTAAVRRMARGSQSHDWLTAWFLQDSAALATIRAGLDSSPELTAIVVRTIEEGIPPGDAELAVAALLGRATTQQERREAQFYRYLLAMNTGRPRDAAKSLRTFDESGQVFRSIIDALYWGGDSALARAMVGRRARAADAELAGSLDERLAQHRDICLVGQWRLAHGAVGRSTEAIEKLRQPLPPGLDPNDSVRATSYAAICADMLEAWRATLTHQPAASRLTLRLDSLVRRVPPGWRDEDNLVVARLLEAHGNIPGALAAVRRRRFDLVPWFTSSYLREEGRLAALAGDTAGAIEAYQHYLVLRPDPEPRVRPEVERVREELSRLVQEPAR